MAVKDFVAFWTGMPKLMDKERAQVVLNGGLWKTNGRKVEGFGIYLLPNATVVLLLHCG